MSNYMSTYDTYLQGSSNSRNDCNTTYHIMTVYFGNFVTTALPCVKRILGLTKPQVKGWKSTSE